MYLQTPSAGKNLGAMVSGTLQKPNEAALPAEYLVVFCAAGEQNNSIINLEGLKSRPMESTLLLRKEVLEETLQQNIIQMIYSILMQYNARKYTQIQAMQVNTVQVKVKKAMKNNANQYNRKPYIARKQNARKHYTKKQSNETYCKQT